ncbi:hypothetical protein MA16_Dca019350 [Dendrobium catenatum]|uniref:Uncharacterized protein n=1 Tax=Dendrobium catenatum TaxID=906689 RepID=A0A2I0WRX8_9ASPA|nr:hypothetical protein MA16_Dca019350 [Dendrobium catenatum]
MHFRTNLPESESMAMTKFDFILILVDQMAVFVGSVSLRSPPVTGHSIPEESVTGLALLVTYTIAWVRRPWFHMLI